MDNMIRPQTFVNHSTADGSGWAEYEFSDGQRRLNLVRWASVFRQLQSCLFIDIL
ncbi:hypothetical protein [Paenibacillus sp. Z6-24]